MTYVQGKTRSEMCQGIMYFLSVWSMTWKLRRSAHVILPNRIMLTIGAVSVGTGIVSLDSRHLTIPQSSLRACWSPRYR